MKSIVSACAVIAIAALSTFGYAPPAHAIRNCASILEGCPTGQQASCQIAYQACVAAGGSPVVSAPPIKDNEH